MADTRSYLDCGGGNRHRSSVLKRLRKMKERGSRERLEALRGEEEKREWTLSRLKRNQIRAHSTS